MPKRILLIDANVPDDPATQIIYKQRDKHLYPFIDESHYKGHQVRLIEQKDTRVHVEQALLDAQTGYVTACGHGRPSYLTGWAPQGQPLPEVLWVGHYAPEEARGKIFHLFACHTGYIGPSLGLGADLITKGAKAFLGYSDAYVINPQYPKEFCDADIEIDKAFIHGNTAEQAHVQAISTFDRHINRLRVDGDAVAAATLENNKKLLVSPVTNPRYGNKQATIEGGHHMDEKNASGEQLLEDQSHKKVTPITNIEVSSKTTHQVILTAPNGEYVLDPGVEHFSLFNGVPQNGGPNHQDRYRIRYYVGAQTRIADPAAYVGHVTNPIDSYRFSREG